MDKNSLGKLYVVATPIGNLKDISLRALEVLESVDFVASEDTRRTKILLSHYKISTKCLAYHKFNEENSAAGLVKLLLDGKSVALATDAGTPCISDPGAVVCDLAIKNGIEVLAIPGACSAIAALSISGFCYNGFEFLGFFPRTSKEQQTVVSNILDSANEAFVIFESPNRILNTLKALAAGLDGCQCLLCNDLTKLHQKSVRGTLDEVLDYAQDNQKLGLGEYVLVIFKKYQKKCLDAYEIGLEARIVDCMIKNNCDTKEAILTLCKEYNKNDLYKASLNLKKLF